MLTATTVFVYRRRRPDLARPYRVWGYPVLPAIFVLCAAAVLVYSYAGNLKGSLSAPPSSSSAFPSSGSSAKSTGPPAPGLRPGATETLLLHRPL